MNCFLNSGSVLSLYRTTSSRSIIFEIRVSFSSSRLSCLTSWATAPKVTKRNNKVIRMIFILFCWVQKYGFFTQLCCQIIILAKNYTMSTKPILNTSSIAFLEKYLNNASPTGYEAEGQKIWMEYLKPYIDTFITDTYGTAVGVINPDAKYKVVIEGHSDEISWYVNYITDNGLIYVIRNGGSDHQIAPSKRVNIHTKKGIVKGVFGWPAIHTRLREKEENAKIDNLFIDIGCTNK